MKQRAKVKWDSEYKEWEITYSDGVTGSADTLEEAHTAATWWELEQVKEQQEVSS